MCFPGPWRRPPNGNVSPFTPWPLAGDPRMRRPPRCSPPPFTGMPPRPCPPQVVCVYQLFFESPPAPGKLTCGRRALRHVLPKCRTVADLTPRTVASRSQWPHTSLPLSSSQADRDLAVCAAWASSSRGPPNCAGLETLAADTGGPELFAIRLRAPPSSPPSPWLKSGPDPARRRAKTRSGGPKALFPPRP